MNFLSGYKTYISAGGLTALAVYQLSQGQIDTAFHTLMLALAAFGLRSAISAATEPAPPLPVAKPVPPLSSTGPDGQPLPHPFVVLPFVLIVLTAVAGPVWGQH